ncbi:MAG: hypothetical protein QOH69_2707 [Actinomycetota bacterium]|jgi:hypothetical protein|nr:hypothetical protein [Actinomycetota bacterium]
MARRLLWIALATILVAAITGLIFLIRAGDPGASNWPIRFDLGSSDNGVLFQFAQDVFRGRPLDWSFSPQVFVFPEIPISLVAYVLAGGTAQGYFLVVAMINNALLFLGLFAVVRYLYPAESLARRILRAAVAMFPLLLLPLLGSTWLFEYQLAPTYYFGMYLLILVAPILFLGCARWVKIALGVGIALTAASNPLALVFTVPALLCVLIVRGATGGFRSVLRPGVWVGGSILLAGLIRVVFFGRLQGASPFAYVSTSIFSGRLQVVVAYARSLLGQPVTAVVTVLGALLVLAGLGVAIVFAVRMIRRRVRNRAVPAVVLYYALVPMTGLAGTLVLLITDYLYLWPVLVLPFVLVLLPLPRRWVPWAAVVASAGLLATGSITGGAENLARASDFFSYRSAETRCLDAKLPRGMTVGYATFSDARRIELTSKRDIRLVQLKSSGVRAYWLTNRDYARDEVGRFFYINEHGDEPAINVSYLESRFGTPDSSFSCAPGQTVLIYTEPSKLAAIKARYSTLPAP